MYKLLNYSRTCLCCSILHRLCKVIVPAYHNYYVPVQIVNDQNVPFDHYHALENDF